jgi:hypothetical protein
LEDVNLKDREKRGDITTMFLRDVGCEDERWIGLAQDRVSFSTDSVERSDSATTVLAS